MKSDKKAIHNTEIYKKQANFNQNKPKNKQPANLQKNKPKFAGEPQSWHHCCTQRLFFIIYNAQRNILLNLLVTLRASLSWHEWRAAVGCLVLLDSNCSAVFSGKLHRTTSLPLVTLTQDNHYSINMQTSLLARTHSRLGHAMATV